MNHLKTHSEWPSVELPAPLEPRPEISHVLFDFDGTLSLIRQGWPEVMVPMFVEALPRQPGETDDDLRRMVLDDIMRLNGKQTIYQMIQLAERIRERGGQPDEPLWPTSTNTCGGWNRTSAPAPPGSRAAPSRPMTCSSTASGPCSSTCATSACRSISPAAPTSPPSSARPTCSTSPAISAATSTEPSTTTSSSPRKWSSIASSQEHGITGRHLLSFGDGYVEIENTKQAGGLAVAVASDEANNGSGRVDEWKRQRLLGVGADAVIPDFRDAIPFVDYLLGR